MRLRGAVAAVSAIILVGTALAVPSVSHATPSADAPTFDRAQLGSAVWVPRPLVAGPVPEYVEPATAWTPRGSVTGAEGVDSTDVETFSIGAVTGGVNRQSGHLMLAARDTSIAGIGRSLEFDRSYDSGTLGLGPVGEGWSSTLDRGLHLEGRDALVYSPSGARQIFHSDPAGGYLPLVRAMLDRPALSVERTWLLTDTTSGYQRYFSAGGYLTAELDDRGNGVVYRYDVAGRPVFAEHVPTERSLRFEYDEMLLAAVEDSAGRRTLYTHDAAGRLLSVLSRNGVTTTFSYDDSGQLISIAIPSNAATGPSALSIDYDLSHRVVALTREGAVTSFDWSTGVGRVTDARGDSRAFARVAPASPAPEPPAAPTDEPTEAQLGQLVGRQHDSLGRVIEVTESGAMAGAERITTYRYDKEDRPVQIVASDGTASWFGYAADGSLEFTVARTLDQAERIIRFSFDASGRLIERLSGSLDEAGTIGGASTTTFEYDAGGRVSAVDTDGRTTRYGYDIAGRVTSVQEPGGDCVAAVPPLAIVGCTRIAYDSAGREVSRVFPGGARLDTRYDEMGRMTHREATDAVGITRVGIRYDYRVDGLVRLKTSDAEEGVVPGAVTEYRHDPRGRLASAVETGPNGSVTAAWTYRYGAAGYRVGQDRRGATGSGLAVDTPSSTVDYEYDGFGRLVSTSESAIIRSDDGGTVPPAVERIADVQGISLPGGEPVGFRRDGSHYYVTDLQGSVVGLFDEHGRFEGGISYSPFGEVRAMAPAAAHSPIRYAGGVALEVADRYRIGDRVYDATLGAFTSGTTLLPEPSGTVALPDPVNVIGPGGAWTVPVDNVHLASYAILFLGLTSCFFGAYDTCIVMAGSAIIGGLAAMMYSVEGDPEAFVPQLVPQVIPLMASVLLFGVAPLVRTGPEDVDDWDLGLGVLHRFFAEFGYELQML